MTFLVDCSLGDSTILPNSRIPILDDLHSDLVANHVRANHVRELFELHSDLVAFAKKLEQFTTRSERVRIKVEQLIDQLNASPPAPDDSSGGGVSGADVGSIAAPPGWGSVGAPSRCTGNEKERRSAPYRPATRWGSTHPAIPELPTDLLFLLHASGAH